jgi:UDP-GlcNAc:undecaprenyl-phosphate GlcNAc-1-phosphate transferase
VSPLVLIGGAALAAVVGFALTPAAGWLSKAVGAIDKPGPRKIHQVPIPRLGGIAVIVALGVTVLVMLRLGADLPGDFLKGLGLGLLPVLLISIIDDIRSVPAVIKFAAHGIGAAIAVSYGFSLGNTVHILGVGTSIAVVAIPVSWLWIVGVTNVNHRWTGWTRRRSGSDRPAAAAVALVTGDPAGVHRRRRRPAIGFLPYNAFPPRSSSATREPRRSVRAGVPRVVGHVSTDIRHGRARAYSRDGHSCG